MDKINNWQEAADMGIVDIDLEEGSVIFEVTAEQKEYMEQHTNEVEDWFSNTDYGEDYCITDIEFSETDDGTDEQGWTCAIIFKEKFMTKEIIEEFANKLRVHGSVSHIDHEIVDEETGQSYNQYIGVDELTDEDIKEIAEWMGEKIYRYMIDDFSICINPDPSEVDINVWKEVK